VKAGVPEPKIPGLDRVEVPAYVYDLGEVRRAHALLRAALPEPSRVFYSLKANPHPAIVRTLNELGCDAEICSPGELAAVLEAGVTPDRIVYTGPGKRDPEVAEAVRAGVRWFSVDSPVGLDQVDRAASAAGRDVRCLLRVNDASQVPGQGLAMTGGPSQFGADADWVASEPAAFRTRLAGLHLFGGSNLDDEPALVAQFRAAIATARRLAGVLGLEPLLLDLGGGFGAPFARSGSLPRFATLAGRLADLLDDGIPGWRAGRPAIAFESGRYLSGTCGSLLTRVADVKCSHGRWVVVLESGINHLGGMSGMRRLPPIVPDLEVAAPDREALRGAIVAGPLCTPLDTWARSEDVPAVRPGDLVRVPNVGAYGLTASLLAFLGHPAPREVVVDAGRIVEVSQLGLVRRVLGGPDGRT
jgi:diaminopimelate decarboxylase